jgi:hypothetical protein
MQGLDACTGEAGPAEETPPRSPHTCRWSPKRPTGQFRATADPAPICVPMGFTGRLHQGPNPANELGRVAAPHGGDSQIGWIASQGSGQRSPYTISMNMEYQQSHCLQEGGIT